MIDLDTPNPITARLIQAFAEIYFPAAPPQPEAIPQSGGGGNPNQESK